MYLKEHQAKEVLAAAGLRLPRGELATSAEAARDAAVRLGVARFAVKAQIRAGGRGPGGGIRLAEGIEAVGEAAAALLGQRIVTEQTGAGGLPVESVYVEEAIDDRESLYLALVVDQESALPVLLGARGGGNDFEARVKADPSIVEMIAVDADGSVDPAGLRAFFRDLGASSAARLTALQKVAHAMIETAFRNDAILVELNPVALTADDEAIALDAKIVIDGNALFRHRELDAFARDVRLERIELVARENEINFVAMEGSIGLVVNGAGLGLATHDCVIDAGGRPANFMDIRTMATSEQIARGVRLLLDEPRVRVLFVNIHGGGMTACDTISRALAAAYEGHPRPVPIVYRAAGQNAAQALAMMTEKGLPFEPFERMSAAAARAAEIARDAADAEASANRPGAGP